MDGEKNANRLAGAYREAVRKLQKLGKNRKIAAAYVFGSYLKNPGTARDIDLCIIGRLGNDEMSSIAMEFEKPVDLSFIEKMPYYLP